VTYGVHMRSAVYAMVRCMSVHFVSSGVLWK